MFQPNKKQMQAQELVLGYTEPVIQGIELNLKPGAVTGILGANGSGKSTLLKGLARLQPPTAGAVLLNGRNISTFQGREFAKEVGILTQQPVAPEGITVRDLVARGRFPHQTLLSRQSAKDKKFVDEVISRVGLKKLATRKVAELSGGQRQRAWVAMALAQDPQILLLDEPTTYLDLSHQLEILDLLVGLNHERGITVVMVLHDLNLAARFCDELILVNQGKVMAQGEPGEVLTPANIARAYSVLSRVIDDPVTGKPMVVPIRNLQFD